MSIKGYPDQKKSSGQAPEYATVGPLRSQQSALDVMAAEFVQLIGTDTVEANSTTTVINATAHAARRGDIIRITSGALSPVEVAVASVTANAITLAEELASAPATSVAFSILRFTRPVVNSSGELPVSASSGPVQFALNAVNTTVAEDTATPANDRPLPTKLMADGGGDVAFGSGASAANVLRTVLATRHETAATPLAVRIAQDGTNFADVGHGAVTTSPRSAAVLGNAAGALAYNTGAAGADTLRAVLATRHETATTPIAVRIAQDGAAFGGVDYGAVTAAPRVAAILGNATGAVDYNSGTAGAQTQRMVLATRHEAAATPVSFRQSNGSAFATMGAGASDSATPRVELAAADATYATMGRIVGTSLTTSYATVLTTTATQATILTILNTCNQTIYVSFDGATHHLELESGESLVWDLGANNRRLAGTTTISARALSSIPTSGSVRVTVVY